MLNSDRTEWTRILKFDCARSRVHGVNSGSLRISRMPPPQDQQVVTKQIIEEHHRELERCLSEVDEAAKLAKDAAKAALQVAEKCKHVEEEVTKMIAQFSTND